MATLRLFGTPNIFSSCYNRVDNNANLELCWDNTGNKNTDTILCLEYVHACLLCMPPIHSIKIQLIDRKGSFDE